MGGGLITLFFLLLSISSSWVNLRLHIENQLYTLPGSVLKVCVWVLLFFHYFRSSSIFFIFLGCLPFLF